MRHVAGPVLAILMLGACAGRPDLSDPALSEADLDLEAFFAGRTVARGQFQDVFGTVRRRFEVEIEGTWDGERLRLVEDFVYEDGTTEQRIWTLVKTGPETWRGTAPGVIGVAEGEERGDTFNWRYVIDLPTGGRHVQGAVRRLDVADGRGPDPQPGLHVARRRADRRRDHLVREVAAPGTRRTRAH